MDAVFLLSLSLLLFCVQSLDFMSHSTNRVILGQAKVANHKATKDLSYSKWAIPSWRIGAPEDVLHQSVIYMNYSDQIKMVII